MDERRFKELARNHNVIPFVRTLAADTLTPVSLYLAARRMGERGFILESVEGGRNVARYSILGIAPRERLTCVEGQVRSRRVNGTTVLDGSLPEALKARLAAFRPAPVEGLPRFSGGFVGYLGYNCAASVERLPVKPDPLGLPDATLLRFDDLVVYDHVLSKVILIANAVLDEYKDAEEAFASAQARLARLTLLLSHARAIPLEGGAPRPAHAEPGARETYVAGVERAKAHIVDGDIFQVVLSTQERQVFEGDPFDAYRLLRMANPSPYHFFLEQDDATILGASPEMLVRVVDRRMEVRPIAGTRPRGATPAEDERLKQELLADPKEAAEHVMLVDLGRNDVGRVCAYGSVSVDEYRVVEPYSHVMHLVSSVSGTLREDAHPVDAFFAAFPAGTVSGAPKIRAMEIIHDLEPVGRGVYAGAVGYLDYRGQLDTCIAIRTTVIRDGVAQIQAGAGIVADSVPDKEFDECRHKMASVHAALGSAQPVAAAPLLRTERAGFTVPFMP